MHVHTYKKIQTKCDVLTYKNGEKERKKTNTTQRERERE